MLDSTNQISKLNKYTKDIQIFGTVQGNVISFDSNTTQKFEELFNNIRNKNIIKIDITLYTNTQDVYNELFKYSFDYLRQSAFNYENFQCTKITNISEDSTEYVNLAIASDKFMISARFSPYLPDLVNIAHLKFEVYYD